MSAWWIAQAVVLEVDDFKGTFQTKPFYDSNFHIAIVKVFF